MLTAELVAVDSDSEHSVDNVSIESDELEFEWDSEINSGESDDSEHLDQNMDEYSDLTSDGGGESDSEVSVTLGTSDSRQNNTETTGDNVSTPFSMVS